MFVFVNLFVNIMMSDIDVFPPISVTSGVSNRYAGSIVFVNCEVSNTDVQFAKKFKEIHPPEWWLKAMRNIPLLPH